MIRLMIIISGILLSNLHSVSAILPKSTNNYNVNDFGATSDGESFDTQAIQAAIDKCSEMGGGTVYFPPGKYLTGTLVLKSNVTLYLEANAIILGSKDINDFHPPHFFYAKNTENISIVGRGVIDGQGDFYWKGKERPFNRPGVMVLLEDSRNVLIEGITIQNAPHWTIFVLKCERVNINGISLLNDLAAPNTDGINICASSKVFVNNCYVQGGDDCICLKSYYKEKPTENVTITNCVVMSDDAGIKGNHGNG